VLPIPCSWFAAAVNSSGWVITKVIGLSLSKAG
jgi:hypothetical protein